MSIIATVEQLEAIYGQPNEASTVKVADRITAEVDRDAWVVELRKVSARRVMAAICLQVIERGRCRPKRP